MSSITKEIKDGMEAEYHFHPTRRWRFDYAWPAQKVAMEVEGGVWTGGRHIRGGGFLEDMAKYNEAVLLGWRVLRFTPQQVKRFEHVEPIKRLLHSAPEGK